MYKKSTLTPSQQKMMEIARTGLMTSCPFFAYYFYSEMEDYPTTEIETAATDGKRIFYNPEYLETLKTPERVFVLAHEIYHVIRRHPARMRHYSSEDSLRGLPWNQDLFNVAADYPINADLVALNIGLCNPAWLYDPSIKPEELAEDLYEKWIKHQPPSGAAGTQVIWWVHSLYGDGRKGGKADKAAQANAGRFDEVLEPHVDAVTGKEDIPSDVQFREAVARAAAAAKAMGNMPGSFQRVVDEILDPQISWREHIRLLVTQRLGMRAETWETPNRRRLVLNPMIILPGRRGFGAGTVVCVIDNSGSIQGKELAAFFGEVGGVIADVRPKRVILIWCDADVRQVDEARSLDELSGIRVKGAPGGGGTDFRPPFEYLAEEQITPDVLIYLTDMEGRFGHAPSYQTIWCSTSKGKTAPFGDVVEITL
jgi:predicted metal-dependent peptidase